MHAAESPTVSRGFFLPYWLAGGGLSCSIDTRGHNSGHRYSALGAIRRRIEYVEQSFDETVDRLPILLDKSFGMTSSIEA